MNTVSEQVFKHTRHSEADRQRYIDQTAKRIERDIYGDLLRKDDEALEIAGDILGFMEPETMVHIMRCALRGDISGANVARQFVLSAIDESVKRTAELRAVRHVEEMQPETH
jgi:hypothetical protein